MSYYDNQESVANIYVGLVERGWKCYGYKADESDSMTDYWSPARWEGIAEKNGFVLLVDVYGTSDSGRKITKKGYIPDWSKIEKLQATINDKAASTNEKETAQKIIDNMMIKENESTVVVSEYPTFKNANPKGCNWHIEKDGNIIAKGKGAFQCDGYLFNSYREVTMKKVNAFIDKIESKIASTEQLEEVQQEVVKNVIKPVEIEMNITEVNENTYLVVDKELTGGVYSGYVYKFDSKFEGKNVSYRFVRMNKKLNKVLTGSTNSANLIYFSEANFNKLFEKGCFHFAELKEVEEITYKTVYKKVNRKGQEDNLLQGDVTETPEQSETKQNNQIEVTNNSLTVELIINDEKNGIELKFSSKPSEGTRELLKENGFRWSKYNKVWFTKKSDKALLFAESFVSAYNDTIEPEQSTNNNEPIIVEAATEQTTDNNEILVNDSALVGRKVFGQWGVMAGWNYGVITGENIYNEVVVNWEEWEGDGNGQGYIYNKDELILVNEDTSLDPIGIYLLPIENNEPEHVENESDQEVTEPTQTEYTHNNKIKLQSITFEWSESSYIQSNTIVNTFTEAEQLIHKASLNAPDDGTYDKTKFNIVWSNGNSYTGRIDIVKSYSFKQTPLKDHILSFINSVITDDGTWYTNEQKESYKHLLDNYSLEDETPLTSQSKHSGKVLDFTAKLLQRQEKQQTEQMKTHFLQNVLPYMSTEEIDELQAAYQTNDESKLNQVWSKLMVSTAIKRATDEYLNQS